MRTIKLVSMLVLALLVTLLGVGPAGLAAGREATVIVHGRPLEPAGPIIVVENHLFVPLRRLAEAAGWTVAWSEAERAAMLGKNEKAVRIDLDGGAAGNPLKPVLQAGCIYVPLRAVGELLGEHVCWDEPTGTAIIGELLCDNGPEDEVLFAVFRRLYAGLPDCFRQGTPEAIEEKLMPFYAGELLQATTAAVWEYVREGPTDYGVFAFLDGTVVQKNPVTATVRIRYAYATLGIPSEEGLLLAGLRQTENGWRIIWENYQ